MKFIPHLSPMAGTRILLVDNGSYEPAATLALRGLALEVSKLIGQEVRPVSTMHSTKIDPALLGGQPAVIFEQAVQQAQLEGIDELVVLPLFIGPSRAITEYLPKVFADAKPGAMKLSIREPLFGPELRKMLIDNLKSTRIAFFSALATLMPSSRSVSQPSAAERETTLRQSARQARRRRGIP